MKILDYDEVNPLQVLHLTMLALDFPLTPEYAAHILCTDARPFPCFTVNTVEDDVVLGQVSVFRLPMIFSEGKENVGGVWAVSTHPNHMGRGIASASLDEAHTRMREAGLRFSTLGTDRSRVSHRLYQRHVCVDMNVWATALAKWETLHQPTHLDSGKGLSLFVRIRKCPGPSYFPDQRGTVCLQAEAVNVEASPLNEIENAARGMMQSLYTLLSGCHLRHCLRRTPTAPGGLYPVKRSDQVQRQFSSIYILDVKMSNQPLMSLILKGLAMAMGVAAAVLSILGTSSPNTLVTLLSTGLFCLAIWAYQ